MAVLAVLSTPNDEDAPDSAPRRIVSALPAVELEVVQFETRETVAVPTFRMSRAPTDAFESVLEDDPAISSVRTVEETDEGAFYRAEWTVDSPLIHCVAAADGMVVRARGTAAEWRLEVWFEDGRAGDFQACCNEREIPLEITRLASLAEVHSGVATRLSAAQREALELAYREGYFEEPRETSQAELAERVGISSSAFGRRLRRGVETLLEDAVLE